MCPTVDIPSPRMSRDTRNVLSGLLLSLAIVVTTSVGARLYHDHWKAEQIEAAMAPYQDDVCLMETPAP